MKKYNFYLKTLVMISATLSFAPLTSIAFADGVPSCNLKTETVYQSGEDGHFKIYWSKETTNVPKGNCDRLGALNDVVGVKVCMTLAAEKKYDCFQVENTQTSANVISSWGVDSISGKVVKSCYACLIK